MKRIAWFSSLANSTDSIAAHVTAELVPVLRQSLDIELFGVDDGTKNYLMAFERHKESPFDAFVYQLEDRSDSFFSRIHLGLIPGIVFFHDGLFTEAGPEPIHQSPWPDVWQKFWHREANWPKRNFDYHYAPPYGEREATCTRVPIFTDARSRGEFERGYKVSAKRRGFEVQDKSYYLPLPVSDKIPLSVDKSSRRILLASPPRIEYRIHKILEALSSLVEPFEFVWLLAPEEEARARELLQEFKLSSARLILERNPKRFAAELNTARVTLHPLFSVFGQLGPYVPQSLMAGVPVILSNFAQADYIPDSIAFKIRPGETEARELRLVLDELLGRGAMDYSFLREYALETYSTNQVATEFLKILDSESETLNAFMKRWSRFELEARSAVVSEALNLLPDHGAVLNSAYRELGWRCHL